MLERFKSNMLKQRTHACCITPIVALIVAVAAQASPSRTEAQEMNVETADAWAKMVLKGIGTEFPNKPSVVYASAEQIVAPREMFPAFYGCFDWHSSVHGHWLLARLLKNHPEMASAKEIRKVLAEHLTLANIQKETAFFQREEQKAFERMYGWAWYLRLVMELDAWDDAEAQTWRANCRPLEELLVKRIDAYLPLLTFPVRTGEHPDTGFALGQIIDYARAMKNEPLESLAIERAKGFYLEDRSYPVRYEPSGQDFFSSGWNEADLMRRVLSPAEFARWFKRFLPDLATQLSDGTIEPVSVSDVTDGKLVHLAGLNLNRAWCMRAVARSLGDDNAMKQRLQDSAEAHLAAGLAYVNSGHYEGDHWLATFALYAISQPDA
jgi:hypothetical protein